MSSNPTCAYCLMSVLTEDALHKHILNAHQSHPRFAVYCKSCGKSWKKYASYRNHIFRKHSTDTLSFSASQSVEPMDLDDMQNDGNEVVDHALLLNQYEVRAKADAVGFILNLQSFHGLSQSAISDVQVGTNRLIETHINIYKEELILKLGSSAPDIEQQLPQYKTDAFASVGTQWKLKKFLKEAFSLLEPVEVKMGERVCVSSVHEYTQPKQVFGYFVPFLENLHRLLTMPEVQDCLASPDVSHTGDETCMFDYEDGVYCKNSSLFKDSKSLRILAYSDDIEVVNAIGASTKKHKLTLLFFTLLNIPPKFRSKLSGIQLIAVAKAQDCREFGFELLMHDFIEGLKILCDNGIDVRYKSGEVQNHKGGLVAFTGDTIASNVLGGFKEGVGFANKVCRTCNITSSEVNTLFVEDDSLLRDEQEHINHCDELETAMTPEARQYWSKEYGINSRSILLKIPEFSVTKCLIHDPMHILFEGITMAEVKHLLNYVTAQKFCTLNYVNVAVSDIAQQLKANCRPHKLDASRLQSRDDRLNFTAHQMMYFAHLLPLAIGCKIPHDDERWKNFVRLVMVQQLCTSPVATSTSVQSLLVLVTKYCSMYSSAYPGRSFTPKVHYLTHLPAQMENFGPIRHQWCMRMEAKNGFFKRKKLKNTKNVPLTVANDHQLWMCCAQHDSSGRTNAMYLQSPAVFSGGNQVLLKDYQFADLVSEELIVPVTTELTVARRAVLNDISYMAGHFVVASDSSEHRGIQFAVIDDIIVLQNRAYFVCTHCHILDFDVHLNAYCICKAAEKVFISQAQLRIPWPVLTVYGGAPDTYYVSPICLSDVDTFP